MLSLAVMHVCLLPTEILLHIFTINIPNGYGWIPIISRAQLAVLARTCREFKGPALDILWECISGFKPLISCLPEGISNTDRRGRLTLQRPILAGEWRLIHQYARRVHSFWVGSSELDMIENHVMQAFMSAPISMSFFPNLRSLYWYDDREHFFPLLRTFLGLTITSIRADFLFSSPSFAQSASFASLGSLCPSIQELTLCVGDSAESSDVICKALSGLRELSRFESRALGRREFLHLASLPSLKSLYFTTEMSGIHKMQSNSTPTIFPQLAEVHIIASSPSEVEHFFRSVRLPSCRSAKVDLYFDNICYNPLAEVLHNILHIPDIIVSLSQCLSPALEIFCVEYEFDPEYVKEDIAGRSYVLGFDAVAPLLPFNRLKHLLLECICTSDINDASFKTLVQSWPQLESLSFGGGTQSLVPPSMTSTALVHLIQHCPRLHWVQISFCAIPVDYDNDPFFFETVPNEKIIALSVGMSPIGDPYAVVNILLRLLPKLTYVNFLGWLDDHTPAPAPSPFEDLEDGWNAVNEILKARNQRRLK
ncbi:uncharacterized protein BJ212DRAFT_1588834 [Suillus subaureus]|uniref:F-box domain-containing protein n=1 Tax=Suillus subaureus TaxID=48587 RepID=A0A9P7E6K0_9AGAM|nr:uncharacterized protein BJ212DRAFT_1588834 [Suillus subaureus]KAG1812811.1 hypothetical protein BJ212DRAFT_1588834 [Suillus subaureus]